MLKLVTIKYTCSSLLKASNYLGLGLYLNQIISLVQVNIPTLTCQSFKNVRLWMYVCQSLKKCTLVDVRLSKFQKCTLVDAARSLNEILLLTECMYSCICLNVALGVHSKCTMTVKWRSFNVNKSDVVNRCWNFSVKLKLPPLYHYPGWTWSC